MVSLREQIKRRQQGLDNGKEVMGRVMCILMHCPIFAITLNNVLKPLFVNVIANGFFYPLSDNFKKAGIKSQVNFEHQSKSGWSIKS